MVTADQGGHGTYLFGTNTCANNAATVFLATGTRPSHDTACAAEPAKQAPARVLENFGIGVTGAG
jgi:hypothetical protein